MKKTLSVVAVFGLALATAVCPTSSFAQCVGCSQSAVQQPVFAGSPIQSYQSVPISNSYQPAVQSYNYSQPVVYGSSVNTSNVSAYSSYPVNSYPTSSYSSPVAQSYPTQTYPTQVYSGQVNAAPTVSYPSQSYPAQTYVASTVPVQSYPVQNYGSQTYPTQAYEGQTYPVQASPTYSMQSNATTYPSNYAQTYTSNSVAQPVVSQPIVSQPTYSQPYAAQASPTSNYATSNYGSNRYTSTSGGVTPGLAQQKAVQAAQMGLQGHVGGGLGGARYEGVGWSSQGPQHAISKCCYWGTRPTAQIGVTKGNNGLWYACVLYY
ncbi:MAG: hypothetical protein AB8B55_15675 [Mariniblastus sp.]